MKIDIDRLFNALFLLLNIVLLCAFVYYIVIPIGKLFTDYINTLGILGPIIVFILVIITAAFIVNMMNRIYGDVKWHP